MEEAPKQEGKESIITEIREIQQQLENSIPRLKDIASTINSVIEIHGADVETELRGDDQKLEEVVQLLEKYNMLVAELINSKE